MEAVKSCIMFGYFKGTQWYLQTLHFNTALHYTVVPEVQLKCTMCDLHNNNTSAKEGPMLHLNYGIRAGQKQRLTMTQ